jgi:hypothetical protein
LEHDLTHWYGNTTEKILSWRDLRKKSAEAGKEASIKLINNWWTYAPWVRKTIDPYKPDTWPTPWDMINTGHFCRSAIALGQAYTFWTLYPDMDCELWLINNKSEQDVHLVVAIDKKLILNYNMGHIEHVEDIDHELLAVTVKSDLAHIKL